MESFSYNMDLAPWLGIEPRLPALGARSLNHRTTRELPFLTIFKHADPWAVFSLLWISQGHQHGCREQGDERSVQGPGGTTHINLQEGTTTVTWGQKVARKWRWDDGLPWLPTRGSVGRGHSSFLELRGGPERSSNSEPVTEVGRDLSC